MKQKFVLLSIIVYCLTISVSAQPKKDSWSIGGSGFWMKTKSRGEDKRTMFDFTAAGQYFILRNFAVGTEVEYAGGRRLDETFKPRYYDVFISPTLEGYIINRPQWGLSLKGLINLKVAHGTEVSFYKLGPKLSYNITPNLTLFSWYNYHKVRNITNSFPGWAVTYPSDNYDLRVGFTYYLHPRQE